MDHLEVIERERRRQVALAHQDAIRKQLEEREQRRREEKERRIKEEHEEELRIEKEQEVERKRREQEQKLIEEKQERERKRKQAMQEAVEIAEREAKLEKMKQKMLKQNHNNNINLTESIVEKDKVPETLEECNKKITAKSKDEIISENNAINKSQNSSNYSSNSNKVNNLDQQNNMLSANNRNENKENVENANNQKNSSCQIIISPRESVKIKNASNDTGKILLTPRDMEGRALSPQLSARTESVALLLQPNVDSFQNMQYAVLVPTINPTTHAAIPIAVPISITTDRTLNSARTENRVLTPTQYRNEKKILCDSSTQTDFADFARSDTAEFSRDRYSRDKANSIELGYDNKSRKDRRSRNEDRSSRDGIEERPKWGANRPPTRYLKQSEKDPLYQRRKLRQKLRENKSYDDKNSSDESPTASPRAYRKKGYVEKRQRALWRKNDHFYARNIKMYQTEIIPLESDKTQIYYRHRCSHDCCCHCRCSRKKHSEGVNKIDILKIEHSFPKEDILYKREQIETIDPLPLPDFSQNIENEEVLDKLECSQQLNPSPNLDEWEISVRSPTPTASVRYNENM